MINENYVISTDSSADLPRDDVKKLGIEVIDLELSLDGKTYLKESEVKSELFYKEIKKGTIPKTTQTSYIRYMKFFRKFLENGKKLLHISFSSGLSGTHNQAIIAGQELSKEYGEEKILIVDSLCASVGQGLLVYYAGLKKKRENCSMTEIFDWINSNKTKINHFFSVDDLFYLKNGGRISGSAAIIGSVLSIKPVLTIDKYGKICIISKVRGRRALIDTLVKKTEEKMTTSKDYGKIFVTHSQNIEVANELKDSIKKHLNITDVAVHPIGPTIGSHLGSGAVGVVFYGGERYI